MAEEQRVEGADEPEIGAHPKGTLAIVGLYGLLFLVGWVVLYFIVFVPRGPLTQ